MQKFLAPMLFLVFAITAAFNSAERDVTEKNTVTVSLGEFLYTVTLNKDMPIEEAQYRWFHEYLEPGVNDSVFEPLLELIKRKQITVYEPNFPFQTKMDANTASELFLSYDSMDLEDPYNPGTYLIATMKNEHHASEVFSVTFHERWEYDPATLTLTKMVLGIIPNLERFSNIGESIIKSSCYIPIKNETFDLTTVTVSGITSDFIVDGSEHSDAYNSEFIAKSATISAGQNTVSGRIIGDIKSRSSEKKFVLYEPDFPFTVAVEKNLKAEKLTAIGNSNMLMFYEDWEINPRLQIFRKKVMGVIPVNEKRFAQVPDSAKWIYEKSALVPFNGFIPQQLSKDVCSIERISFDVRFKSGYESRPKEMSMDDSAFLDSVALDIREHVKRMEVKSFGPRTYRGWCDPFANDYVEFNKEQVRELFYRTDTVEVENIEDGTFIKMAIEPEYHHDLDCGLRFFENWTFNFKKQSFSKQTLFVGMDRYLLEDQMYQRGFRFIYFYKCPLTTPKEAKSAEFLYRSSIYSGSLLNYNEVDPDESENGEKVIAYFDNWHENIDPSRRYAFIQPVIDLVRLGTVQAYKPGQGSAALSVSDFNLMLKDLAVKSGLKEKPGMEFVLFNQIFFEERWYYNRVNGQIYKEVVGITFAHCDYAYNTETHQKEPVIQSYFTIRLNIEQ